MWFKNLTLFRINETFDLSADEFAERLRQRLFRHCLSQEMMTHGWAPPLGRKAVDLVHSVSGCLLVCLQTEEKILPPAVVREAVDEKIVQIEEREMRTVRRREKELLRDDVMQELLPRAFTRNRRDYAYIDLRAGWLIVDSASRKNVAEMTGMLRESLGSLPITPPRPAHAPALIMTEWLGRQTYPEDIALADECELRDAGEESGVVRCKGQDLLGDEIGSHLEAGKQVTRLALVWNQRISLVLSEDLSIRRLRFLDVLQEQLENVDAQDAEALFDAQFALMVGELGIFLPRLLALFGGEASDSSAPSAVRL